MKNTKLQCEFCPAGYSRFIMFNGGETGSDSPDLPKSPEKAEPLEKGDMNPEAAGSEAKGKGARMVSAAERGATELKSAETPESEYNAEPFTQKELEKRTGGFPEIKPAKPADLVKAMIDNWKAQNPKMHWDHGDVASAFIDAADGKGEKEYRVVCDKSSGKSVNRLFRQA